MTAKAMLPPAESPPIVIFWGRNPISQTRYLYAAIPSMMALGNGFSRSKMGGPALSRYSTDNTLDRDVEYLSDPLGSDAVG